VPLERLRENGLTPGAARTAPLTTTCHEPEAKERCVNRKRKRCTAVCHEPEAKERGVNGKKKSGAARTAPWTNVCHEPEAEEEGVKGKEEERKQVLFVVYSSN